MPKTTLEELEAKGRAIRESATAEMAAKAAEAKVSGEGKSKHKVKPLVYFDGFDAAITGQAFMVENDTFVLNYDEILMAEILARRRFSHQEDPWQAAKEWLAANITNSTDTGPGMPLFWQHVCDECGHSPELCDCYPRCPPSESVGVTWEYYPTGRRFRVIREGARMVHGNFGVDGGRVPLPVGSIIQVRGWLSDFDGDIHLLWTTIDGRPIEGIIGNDPHQCPWAVFKPDCEIRYTAFGRDEVTSAPDPSYLQPIDQAGG